MNSPVLKVNNLSFSYDGIDYILKNISFEVKQGEILGVLGPNGGGKSTLMKIISGLERNYQGEIAFNGINVLEMKHYPFELFSYVPQTSELNTVLPVKVSEYLDFTKSLYKIKDNKIIDELLELVGIAHKKDVLISELSGGERQRVLIARAMIHRPRLLLLDEPTKGLDSNGQDQLLNLIELIRKRDQTAIVIVDHNINQIIKSCQNILCLNRHHHWHNKKDFLTKNVLEDIYHCEFEHLLIHEKDMEASTDGPPHTDHIHCNHDHSTDHKAHAFIRKGK